jgi:D-alanyl-lipoteichoic acid acyltransferase DltB (MBOAT superfamily)
MVGVLLLGFVLVIAVLLCSFVQASFPVVLSVVSLFVALMVAAGDGTMVQAIMAGGVILVGGLVLATASDTYEEIRLARRRAKPRRRPRPRPRVSAVAEAEPDRLDEQRRAA